VLRARIDPHRCIGAGTCIFLAPTAFRWQGNDKAEVTDSTTVDEDTLKAVAAACPTQAIGLEEDQE
jgi:ferredoxin